MLGIKINVLTKINTLEQGAGHMTGASAQPRKFNLEYEPNLAIERCN